MLIICPDCESSYEVEAADIGASGRKVRCTECGAVWLARQAESNPSQEFAETPAPDEVTVEDIDVFDEVEAAPADPEAAFGDDDFAAPAPIENIISNPALQEAKEASRRGRRQTRLSIVGNFASRRRLTTAAVACLAVLACSIVGRGTIVSVLPDLAGLYEIAGMPVNLRGLDFADITTQENVEDGVPQLAVRGTIRNVAGESVAVPRLRLAVVNRTGREIFVWTAVPARGELGPGEELPFFAQIASPPADGREVIVRFVGSRDGVQTAAR